MNDRGLNCRPRNATGSRHPTNARPISTRSCCSRSQWKSSNGRQRSRSLRCESTNTLPTRWLSSRSGRTHCRRTSRIRRYDYFRSRVGKSKSHDLIILYEGAPSGFERAVIVLFYRASAFKIPQMTLKRQCAHAYSDTLVAWMHLKAMR